MIIFNTLNNRINEERNLIPNINNSKDKKMSVNEYNYLNNKNRNYFLNILFLLDNFKSLLDMILLIPFISFIFICSILLTTFNEELL